MNTSNSSERERFIALLKKSGWSQAEAARELKVFPNYIHMIVRRGSKPGPTLLELLEIKVRLKDEDMLGEIRLALAKLPPKKRAEAMKIIGAIVKVFTKDNE